MSSTKKSAHWATRERDMSSKALLRSLYSKRTYTLAKDKYTATLHDDFLALAYTIRDRLTERWIKTQQEYHRKNVKRVYYLSLEFLIGRLLGASIINLDIGRQVETALDELDLSIDEVCEQESDAGLGNGGLGRLAACLLDSMATLGVPGQGYGIRYEYGMFNQKIKNGYQTELPDEWLDRGNPWEIPRPEYAMPVKFYGRIREFHDKNGILYVQWVDTEDVIAMPYDIPIPGYKNEVVNTLRLWSAKSSKDFDLTYFNDGDYERAVYQKLSSENISKVLYPNDIIIAGQELRLKQEYFFTAASIADIIRRFKAENNDCRDLAEKVVIQLNDTHPSLAIVELLRVLIDDECLSWDEAWVTITKTFAYTNHTIMPEALESWPLDLFGTLLPRHTQFIYEINRRFLEDVARRHPGNTQILEKMSLIEESTPKRIRMAHLCMVASFSINGVSELHTHILKTQVFKEFYEMFPEKFNNKTNGVTQRRWLKKANPTLADLITETIGEGWACDLSLLKQLKPYAKDSSFRERWASLKHENKKVLARYIFKTQDIIVDPSTLFDVQVKRIHEYKRQLLFCFYIISEYLKIKHNPRAVIIPRTFIFSGKAAPGYFMAKLIIKFINNVAEIINKDKGIKDVLKVVFLENYRVSLAEKIFPASELSEQISTAGMEASGTGCMKFMLNGALTLGALDGANIEIAQEVGKENMFIFGMGPEEITSLIQQGYSPQDFINRSPALKEIIQLIKSNFFSSVEYGLFEPILNEIITNDKFFVCADFDSYNAAQQRVSQTYADQDKWNKKSILNVAASGKFSTDRTIKEYVTDIWKVSHTKCQKD